MQPEPTENAFRVEAFGPYFRGPVLAFVYVRFAKASLDRVAAGATGWASQR